MSLIDSDTRISLPVRCPQIAEKYVTRSSPKRIKEAVFKIAKYFRREGNYDFTQFNLEDKEDYQVYLFKREYFNGRTGDEGSEIFGCACFRWRENEEFSARWSMQWVWLHPYFRNQGLLKNVWPEFIEKFGANFFIETPYSRAMLEFLKVHASDEQLALFHTLGWSALFPRKEESYPVDGGQ